VNPEISSTDPSIPQASEWCVVFDARTGDVVHIHQVIALGGSALPPRAEIAEQALSHVPPSEMFGPAEGLARGEIPSRASLEVAFPAENIRPEDVGPWSSQRLRVDLDTRQIRTQS